MRLRTSVMCALSFVAVSGNAADETSKWYLTPQAGYLWTDDDRTVDDDYYYGLGVGKHLSPEWSLELNGVNGSYDAAAGGEPGAKSGEGKISDRMHHILPPPRKNSGSALRDYLMRVTFVVLPETATSL